MEYCQYIYLLEAVGSGRVKIGKTFDVAERINDLQGRCPFQLNLLAVLRITEYDSGKIEKEYHRKYDRYRCFEKWFSESTTEWFDLPSDILEYLVEEFRNDTRAIAWHSPLIWEYEHEVYGYTCQTKRKHKPTRGAISKKVEKPLANKSQQQVMCRTSLVELIEIAKNLPSLEIGYISIKLRIGKSLARKVVDAINVDTNYRFT